MAERRFHSRRQWHNTRLVLYAGPFLLLGGLLLGVTTGRFLPLAVILVGFVLVLALALLRDASTRALYTLAGIDLVLTKGRDALRIPGSSVLDASLVDRQAARDYFFNKVMPKHASKGTAQRAFLRFCTVDIGLRTFTFGLGRGIIDRMPDARQDLVLLRLRNQEDLLLSPTFNHDMVESVLRLQRKAKELP
jgi:hypothetical protein